MLFMLWWAVKETGETHHGCPCCCKTLTYLWLCLHDGQCSSYVQNSFLSQQYTIVAEALKCTVPMHWIIPVKTYSLYVQLTSSVIYIYTHLLNVPLLEENLDIMLKHRLNACAQISDVGVLNNQMLLLGWIFRVMYNMKVFYASGRFSYRVLKCIFLCSVFPLYEMSLYTQIY